MERKTAHGEDWFMFPKPNKNAKLRIFCFPYAGAGASIYKKWEDSIPMEVELCVATLPGRENRRGESAFKDFSSLIEVVAEEIIPLLDKPYVFFGHSMGALLSFELARTLGEKNIELPIHLILSGINPLKSNDKLEMPLSSMSDHDFISLLHRLNGTPTEVLENKEVLNYFLPVIKADFALLNSYSFAAGLPLECSITAYGGMDDTPAASLKDWATHTVSTFAMKMFQGDHFFINSARKEVLAALRADLMMIVNKVTERDEMAILENFLNCKKKASPLKRGATRGGKQRALAENIKKNVRMFK